MQQQLLMLFNGHVQKLGSQRLYVFQNTDMFRGNQGKSREFTYQKYSKMSVSDSVGHRDSNVRKAITLRKGVRQIQKKLCSPLNIKIKIHLQATWFPIRPIKHEHLPPTRFLVKHQHTWFSQMPKLNTRTKTYTIYARSAFALKSNSHIFQETPTFSIKDQHTHYKNTNKLHWTLGFSTRHHKRMTLPFKFQEFLWNTNKHCTSPNTKKHHQTPPSDTTKYQRNPSNTGSKTPSNGKNFH